MKRIGIVYGDSTNPDVIRHLEQDLQMVYGDYAVIQNYFMDQMTPGSFIEADVLVVINNRLLPRLRRYSSMKNVVCMTRSIKKAYLDEILKIPADTDVLLVNDTRQNAEEMILMCYELGISHLNLIPYDTQEESTGAYRHIRSAITPNEPHMVPAYITSVINTGYRDIGFNTMVQIMDILELKNESIIYRLLQYISSIVEPMPGYRVSYFDGLLKEQMLNQYIYHSEAAIFLVDVEGRLIYFNKRAQDIFQFPSNLPARIETYLPPELMEHMGADQDVPRQMLTIDGVNYVVDKVKIGLEQQDMGCFITMQDEIALKNIETSFNRSLKEKGLYAKYTFQDILHTSASMHKSIELGKRAANTVYTILIGGESGVGKELFAQALHNYSDRRNMPFVAVNCAVISESLLESELFGYEEGSFTGARKKGKLGVFELANRGTIFLDEIGDISPRLQLGLLRVLQERQIMRIGSNQIINIDVRIIAATNKDLWQEVEKGNFRRDLYYRLNTISIMLPPVRERRDDILPLFRHFMGAQFSCVTPEEIRTILQYPWPGNVRELENCALYYKALGELPAQIRHYKCGKSTEKERTFDIKSTILQILLEHQSIGHGLGRTAILGYLREQSVSLSDIALRQLLEELAEEGYLTIGKGRQGTSLTARGVTLLQSNPS